jgi:glycosyltransferase involved in cell wall biosynthesis
LNSLIPNLDDHRELIVVNDGSIDNTAKIIASLTYNIQNTYLHTIPNSGRSIARNFGANAAHGEWIIFIDDDIEFNPDFLLRHEAIRENFPDAWITGTVRQKIEDVPHRDFLTFRAKLDYDRAQAHPNALGLIEVDSFSTQQLSVRSELFRRTGGFDERLRDCEDFELSVRVRDAGHKIFHDPKNVVFHRDFSTFDKFIKRQLEYRKGRNFLAADRPELAARFPQLFDADKETPALERLIRNLFVYGPFWRWFFESRLRLVVPKTVLHTAYDLVTSSTFLFPIESRIKRRDR